MSNAQKSKVITISVTPHLHRVATEPLMYGQLTQLVTLFLQNIALHNSNGTPEEYLLYLNGKKRLELLTYGEIHSKRKDLA